MTTVKLLQSPREIEIVFHNEKKIRHSSRLVRNDCVWGGERERGGESRRRARESMWRESGEGEGRGRKLQGRPLEEEVPHISELEGNCTDIESGRDGAADCRESAGRGAFQKGF